MLTRPLALLAYATLCAVEARHSVWQAQASHLIEQAALAQVDAKRLGATRRDGRRMWEWLAGSEATP